jgi:RNA polymerase sigma-70 factor (ECF subfamily)
MDANDSQARLSQLKTYCTMMVEAHQERDEAANLKNQLLLRYHGAVYRYLLAILRNADAAEDLTRDFAVKFLAGDFKGVNPGGGRLRKYLKASLRNLARKHWREKRRWTELLEKAREKLLAQPAAGDQTPEDEFTKSWRKELYERVWAELEQFEKETGERHFSVLRLKEQFPKLRSAELAERLGPQLGKTLSADNFRKALQRAREKFNELLVEEVSRSLTDSSPDALEEELIELELLTRCKAALEKRKDRSQVPVERK